MHLVQWPVSWCCSVLLCNVQCPSTLRVRDDGCSSHSDPKLAQAEPRGGSETGVHREPPGLCPWRHPHAPVSQSPWELSTNPPAPQTPWHRCTAAGVPRPGLGGGLPGFAKYCLFPLGRGSLVNQEGQDGTGRACLFLFWCSCLVPKRSPGG